MIVENNSDINKLDLVKYAIDNHCGVQFKSLFNDTPSWESFIKHLDKSVIQPSPHYSDQYIHIMGQVFFWNYLSIQVDRAHLYFKEYKDIMDNIKNMHPENKVDAAFSIISFTRHEPSAIGNHFDDIDIFSWQCQGESIWYIGDEGIDRKEFIMSPGDMIFCPAWVTHEVHSLSPRAAISTYVISKRENHRPGFEVKRYT